MEGIPDQPPLFPLPEPLTPERGSISISQIETLFSVTDWGVVLFQNNIKDMINKSRSYKNVLKQQPLAAFKIFSLPFLVNLPSEWALSRELREKDALRSVCGFHGKPPTRGQLWNFRNEPQSPYSFVMFHVLIALAIAAKRLNWDLPFVKEFDDDQDPNDDHTNDFILSDLLGIRVQVWSPTPENTGLGSSSDRSLRELYDRAKPNGHGIEKNLNLPTNVRVWLGSGSLPYTFVMCIPPWMEDSQRFKLMGTDTITLSKNSINQGSYVACNVLVLREGANGIPEILLARRLSGSGTGQYTLPGGKRRDLEKPSETALRELSEETGLKLIESTPISIKIQPLKDGRQAFSIGVKATNFLGTIQHREIYQNTPWQWYPINELPMPIFPPSNVVIRDYLNNRFPNMTWDMIDDIVGDVGTDVNTGTISGYVQETLFDF